MDIQKKRTSPGWYLLGGLIAGAAAGLLLAPQSGADTREDLDAWRRRATERARALFERFGGSLPERMKARASAVAERTRDGLKQFTEA